MIEIPLRCTLLSEEVLNILEEEQQSNVNKNAKRYEHTPRCPFIF